jgi:hypothetical protein
MDSVLTRNLHCELEEECIDGMPGFFKVLRGVLTADECKRIIEIADEAGFEQAALRTNMDGDYYNTEYRKSQRCIIDSVAFADELWSRISDIIPAVWSDGEEAAGLNERIRILKYEPGDEFKTHADGTFTCPGRGLISKLTLLIYLNDNYEGGYTTYVCGDDTSTWDVPIRPTVGAVVLQDQNIMHYVPPLLSGVKYAIRTDVMYRVKSASNPEYKTIYLS